MIFVNQRQKTSYLKGKAMNDRQILGSIVCVIILGLSWVVTGNDFFLREVFEQTKVHNQGTVQGLQMMRFEYVRATPEQRKALASTILCRAADYDDNKLPAGLYTFVKLLRREQSCS